jgi:hypothetical protein
MAYRTAKRTVNHGNELWMAVKANLSDRYLDKAAKSYGRQNVFQEIGWANGEAEVTLDLTVPDGWEPTGEYRVPLVGEYYLSMKRNVWMCDSENETGGYQKFIIRRKEPDAVQLAKAVRVLVQSMTTPQIGGLANSLANKIIADFERESK